MDVDSSSKFIGSLTKFLQSLCNGYVEFQRGVELVGHIYLSIDTGEKVDYILHEKVSKNDENSVTFVSNSFHARPLDKDKDKEKTSSNKDVPTSKTGASARGSKDTSSDEDDDVMIVDKSKGVLGSTNSGTILPRGVKRVASPSSDQRLVQRTRSSTGPSSARQGSGSNPVTSPPRTLVNRQQAGGPSATVTSQDSQQENLNMGDLKLEQITRDELLSLASQVGEGGSGPPPASSVPRSQSQRTGAAAANSSGDRPVWIKQEAADDNGAGDSDAGWSCARDDSNSNSGSNLYPVMLHQNPAAYSNPVFPGFSGPNTSGSPSAVNPYANPMPGSSQDISGLDPSVPWVPPTVVFYRSAKTKSAESSRRYREKLKAKGPEHYRQYQQQARERMRRLRVQKRQRRSASMRTHAAPMPGTAPGSCQRPAQRLDQQQTSERAAEQRHDSDQPPALMSTVKSES